MEHTEGEAKALRSLIPDVQTLKLVADNGQRDAQLRYGTCLLFGDGVRRDSGEGFRYLEMAARQGVGEAKGLLMMFTLMGGMLKSLSKQEVKRMMQGNSPDQLFMNAVLLLSGLIPGSETEAAKYLKRAADKGHMEARFFYANWLVDGQWVRRDLAQAARYYKLAADQGKVDAQSNYGICLRYGAGVPRNPAEAVRYFKMAADQGHGEGQLSYGIMLLQGEGVPQNMPEAARYFKMAADQGQPTAQYNYGCCLMKGEGVEKDLTEAFRYLKQAADRGHTDAHTLCVRLMSGEDSPTEDSPKENSPTEESPKEDSPTEESTKEESPKEESESDSVD